MEESAMLPDRWRNEQQFHDRQALERAVALRPEDYCFSDNHYLNHESWIAPAFSALGDVNGLRVLDVGCGHGMASVVLARRGAQVTACDLSLGYVREACMRARANRVQSHQLVCKAEQLPFVDASFERIWGNAILHHLDMRQAAREVHRVLTSKGRAVFCEPWGGNRWLNLVREGLPYPGKRRTPDENPLRRQDLTQLQEFFPDLKVHGFQLFSMLGRFCRQRYLIDFLGECDEVLLRYLPAWQHYCRYVVVILCK
jgi:SAM-dependent methyltransferase